MNLLIAILVGATFLLCLYWRVFKFNISNFNLAFKVSIFFYLSLGIGLLFIDFNSVKIILENIAKVYPPKPEYGINNFGFLITFVALPLLALSPSLIDFTGKYIKDDIVSSSISVSLSGIGIIFLICALNASANWFTANIISIVFVWIVLIFILGILNVILGIVAVPINLGIILSHLYNTSNVDVVSILGLLDLFPGNAYLVSIVIAVITSAVGSIDLVKSLLVNQEHIPFH